MNEISNEKPVLCSESSKRTEGTPALLNKREAAEQLRISQRTLDREKDKRLIEWVQIGRKVFFRQEQLDQYINRQTRGGNPDRGAHHQ